MAVFSHSCKKGSWSQEWAPTSRLLPVSYLRIGTIGGLIGQVQASRETRLLAHRCEAQRTKFSFNQGPCLCRALCSILRGQRERNVDKTQGILKAWPQNSDTHDVQGEGSPGLLPGSELCDGCPVAPGSSGAVPAPSLADGTHLQPPLPVSCSQNPVTMSPRQGPRAGGMTTSTPYQPWSDRLRRAPPAPAELLPHETEGSSLQLFLPKLQIWEQNDGGCKPLNLGWILCSSR